MEKFKRIIELGWDVNTLRNAKVMVVGAGALGNEVLKNLALLGVGNILVVDMDVIESHNLTRTVLFSEADIGKYKAEVAAEKVRSMDANIHICPFVSTVQDVFGLGVYQEVDIVFGCLDNIQARIDVNRYCYQTQTFYIDAGLRKLDGDVKIFAPPYDVCLDCTLNERLREEAWRRFSCLKLRSPEETDSLPTSPTIASIMAGFQVQIAVKYLHKINVSNGKRISIFGNIDEVNTSKLSRNPYCPTHYAYEPLPENIIPLPHNSKELTLAQLLAIVQSDFGAKASIALDYDLIVDLSCTEHQFVKKVFKKRGTLYVDEVICPHCQKEERGKIASLMREYFINQIDGTESPDLLAQNLVTIGTPLLQIFTAKLLKDGVIHYRHYLLAKDLAELW